MSLYRWIKSLIKKALRPWRRAFYLVDFILPEQTASSDGPVQNLRVLFPAERVTLASPEADAFVAQGKYFREGWFDRPEIFVCELPQAYLHPGSGLVCTRELKMVADLPYRIPLFQPYGRRKPRHAHQVPGLCSSISYCVSWNYYHWMIDCLPRLHSLALAEPREKVTLLMPDSLGRIQRESLACVLPAHFELRFYPADTWLQVERFLWPSLVSGRGNACLPAEYYDSIRRPVWARLGLSPTPQPRERLYLTRRKASRRRILNEDALVQLLYRYQFTTIELEDLSFREQVELFHRAAFVLGPHGAGFNLLLFSGPIEIVVLHPNPVPQNQFHTLAKGLGQNYHFLLHDQGEEDNFEVDLPRLEHVLRNELNLGA